MIEPYSKFAPFGGEHIVGRDKSKQNIVFLIGYLFIRMESSIPDLGDHLGITVCTSEETYLFLKSMEVR